MSTGNRLLETLPTYQTDPILPPSFHCIEINLPLRKIILLHNKKEKLKFPINLKHQSDGTSTKKSHSQKKDRIDVRRFDAYVLKVGFTLFHLV